MLLENFSRRVFQHSHLDENQRVKVLELKPGHHAEIPDEVAKVWLGYEGIREYIDPAIARAKEEVMQAQIEALKKENEALKKDEKTAPKKQNQKNNG